MSCHAAAEKARKKAKTDSSPSIPAETVATLRDLKRDAIFVRSGVIIILSNRVKFFCAEFL